MGSPVAIALGAAVTDKNLCMYFPTSLFYSLPGVSQVDVEGRDTMRTGPGTTLAILTNSPETAQNFEWVPHHLLTTTRGSIVVSESGNPAYFVAVYDLRLVVCSQSDFTRRRDYDQRGGVGHFAPSLSLPRGAWDRPWPHAEEDGPGSWGKGWNPD